MPTRLPATEPKHAAAPGFRRRLLAWYDRHRRDLPWRVPPPARPDAYRVLVSEAMLQQTQVATVIPYFHRFIERFPTIQALATSSDHEVLKSWQGLGYYSRACNLLKAARAIVQDHGGIVPRDVETLLSLPGIGRYTAGAVASIAYDVPSPILDGNVARVLCRIHAIESDPRDTATTKLLWQLASESVPNKRAGDFNSAMMELGATVCTPRSPQCLLCPVAPHCQARAAGIQDRIPPPRKSRAVPTVSRAVFCIARDGRWLIEQRPPTGRWAGMWQFITRETPDALGVPRRRLVSLGVIEHALTHRRYRFEVFRVDGELPSAPTGEWVTHAELARYPLPRPHVRIAAMIERI